MIPIYSFECSLTFISENKVDFFYNLNNVGLNKTAIYYTLKTSDTAGSLHAALGQMCLIKSLSQSVSDCMIFIFRDIREHCECMENLCATNGYRKYANDKFSCSSSVQLCVSLKCSFHICVGQRFLFFNALVQSVGWSVGQFAIIASS